MKQRALLGLDKTGVWEMQTLQKPSSNQGIETIKIETANAADLNLLCGIGLAVGSTFLPFALSYAIARAAHLTGSAFPGSAPVIAMTGLISTMLAIVAVYECRNSVKSLCILTSAIFAVMAVLVSLIVM